MNQQKYTDSNLKASQFLICTTDIKVYKFTNKYNTLND